jgi:hypothetical protein
MPLNGATTGWIKTLDVLDHVVQQDVELVLPAHLRRQSNKQQNVSHGLHH